jgi:hypothetical protein
VLSIGNGSAMVSVMVANGTNSIDRSLSEIVTAFLLLSAALTPRLPFTAERAVYHWSLAQCLDNREFASCHEFAFRLCFDTLVDS